jgi:hypothetical protein
VFQVVVLPPAESLRGVEELRRLHDPAFHRIAAHVALLPPFDADDASLPARFDAAAAGPAFDSAFGAPLVHGDALCLPLARGDAEMRALRGRLAAALLGPADEPPRAPLSLRVGLVGSAAEGELARRALSTLPPPAPWTVDSVVLVMEDVRGLWHEVRRRTLG